MRRDPRLSLWGLLALVALIPVVAGCGGRAPGHLGGGAGGGEPVAPPETGTATIQGVVVSALNTGLTIPGAVIKVLTTALETTSRTDNGTFKLEHAPAGSVTLDVTYPSGAFHDQQLTVTTTAKQTTHVTIAAVPISTSVPNQITLNPTVAQIDLGGQVSFKADVRTFGLPVNVVPSLALIGEIGTVRPTGLFTASREGKGTLLAIVGNVSATASIEVVGALPPRMGTLSVTPDILPAEGGLVRVAVTITSGPGIRRAVAEIRKPKGVSTVRMTLEAGGGNEKDGTWVYNLQVPPNSNKPDSTGHQLPQRYSVRVIATDARGRGVTSSWEDIDVAGLDNPPQPPSGS